MEEQQPKRQSKGMLIGIIIAVLVAAGGASAFFFLKSSPKQDYLKAEKATVDQATELFKDRYANEVKWAETQLDKPVDSTLKLSADWNDPNVDDSLREAQSIVNNSEIVLNSIYDAKKKELELGINGSLGTVSIDPAVFNVDAENLFLSLPFTKDVLFVNGKDFGKLMKEMDPYYDGPEEIDFSTLFDQEQLAARKFQTYVMDEYGKFLYKELPDEAFESEKEDLDLYGEKLKAEKLSMMLTEQQSKDLIKSLFKKVQQDEQFKKLLKDVIIEQSTGGIYAMPGSKEAADTLMEDFDSGIQEAIDSIDENLHLPDGIQSTIWVHKKSIVKRSFAVTAGEEVELQIEGEQLLEKDQQQWTYDFIAIDKTYNEENKVTFTGDLNWDGKKGKDTMKLLVADVEIGYEGEESLDGKERTFNRGIHFNDSYDNFKLIWDGNATHEKDSATASHQFKVDGGIPYVGDITLNLDTEGKIVKKVDMPTKDDAVNVGTMSAQELEDYLYNEIMPQFGMWSEQFMTELYNY